MRIETIALKGFLRFRDTVTLDLRELPPGLIAIVGGNGEGKTTLLEAAIAAIERSFPSRDKELFAYATDRDSFLDVQIAMDGCALYRARVNVDGPKRGSDAVLEQIAADGTRIALNDGKVSTYDDVVKRIFPPKDLLLASAFAAQNKAGSFIALDKRTRKQLFMTLLGIERYQQMSDTARQAAALVEQTGGRLRAVRDVLVRDTGQALADELDRLSKALQVEGGDAEVRRQELQASLAALDARRDIVQDQVAAYVAAVERQRSLDAEQATRQADIVALGRQRVEAEKTLESETRAIEQKILAAEEQQRHEVDDIITVRDKAVTDAKTRIGKNDDLVARANAIRAAVATVAVIDATIAEKRAWIDRARVEKDALYRVYQEAEQRCDRIAQAETDLGKVQTDAALLDTVPCGGAGEYAACAFLKNATAAKARIPDLQALVDDRDSARRIKEVRHDSWDTIAEQIATAGEQIEALVQRYAEHHAIAKDAEYLAVAETRIAALKETIATTERDANTAVMAAKTRCRWRLQELVADSEAARARYDQRLRDINERRVALDRTVARIADDLKDTAAAIAANEQGHAEAVLIDRDLNAARVEWDQIIAVVARVKAEAVDLERRRQSLAAKRAELDAIEGRIRTLDSTLLDWQLLAKALGRDGLPVLEIDAAGPTISALVNELLTVCFGTRFTIELATQQAKADGKGQKEDFTVRVFDNLRGGEPRDIADLSGGEQVIVAEALMNAIAIYVNTRSQTPVRTCWRDETTGALDPENASRYLAMLRKVQELGGFHHVLFITHNPDAAALADAQIRVQGGRVTTSLPPFAEAA